VGANKNEVQQGKDRVSLEGQLLDQKSLRAVTGKTADWNEIAKDCIAFANATGGRLRLGIEDGQDVPPSSSSSSTTSTARRGTIWCGTTTRRARRRRYSAVT